MTQLVIDFAAAKQARDEGAQRALEHTLRHDPDWKTTAYTWLCAYALTHEVFSGEDVSDAHIAAGMPQPKDLRSWGPLYRLAVTEGYIRRVDNNGWSRRRSSPCPRYLSLVYRSAA